MEMLKNKILFYIILYLLAIILANLSVFYFGAYASIINSFLFIGLSLTSRDKLHETWLGKNFALKMGALILLGSLLSWLFNKGTTTIAIASFVAFSISAIVDTIVYQIFYKKNYFTKVNLSNVSSAFVDSLIFPTIAFGSIMPIITLGQFVVKVFGGFIWAILLNKKKG